MKDSINVSDIIKESKKYNLFIFDFDYTLTTNQSESSIGVFTNYLSDSYKLKKKMLDKIILGISNEKLLRLFWKIKINVLSNNLKSYNVDNILFEKDFIIRDDFKHLFNYLLLEKKQIIIYSSGLDFVIKRILKKNNLWSDSIKILANSVDNKVLDNVITPKKKKIDIKEKSVMIFGDKKEDLDILEYGRKFIVKDTIYLYDGDNDAR